MWPAQAKWNCNRKVSCVPWASRSWARWGRENIQRSHRQGQVVCGGLDTFLVCLHSQDLGLLSDILPMNLKEKHWVNSLHSDKHPRKSTYKTRDLLWLSSGGFYPRPGKAIVGHEPPIRRWRKYEHVVLRARTSVHSSVPLKEKPCLEVYPAIHTHNEFAFQSP